MWSCSAYENLWKLPGSSFVKYDTTTPNGLLVMSSGLSNSVSWTCEQIVWLHTFRLRAVQFQNLWNRRRSFTSPRLTFVPNACHVHIMGSLAVCHTQRWRGRRWRFVTWLQKIEPKLTSGGQIKKQSIWTYLCFFQKPTCDCLPFTVCG